MGENPFSATLKLIHPISDPDIEAKAEGFIKLAGIDNFYPLDEKLSGELKFNLEIKGKLSSLEREKYEDFTALGYLMAKNINYDYADFKQPLNIESAQLNFSPKYIDLADFKATTNNNDIRLNGKLSNYIPYYFDKGKLNASLVLRSGYLNIDELFNEEDTTSSTDKDVQNSNSKAMADTVSQILELPANIVFTATTNIKTLVYDEIEMKNLEGKIKLDNQTLFMDNLSMDAVKGKMHASGFYSSQNPGKPIIDLSLKLDKLSIPEAYNKFAIIKQYLPVAKKTEGVLDADFRFTSILNKDMLPDYSTLNGSGNISTSQIKINDLNSLLQIAEALKLSDLKHLYINGFDANFTFEDGKMIVEPTDFTYKNIKGNLGGWTSFDKRISYDLRLDIPREEFGSDANNILQNVLDNLNAYGTKLSLPDMIPLNIGIGGTLDKPIIKTAFNNRGESGVKDRAEEEIEKQKQDLKKKASAEADKLIEDAEKRAAYLISEAKKQADLLRNNANEAKKDLLAEYDKQAGQLIAEGKKNGYIAELAAKEAAKKLRKEAEEQAGKLIDEAKKQSDSIEKQAAKKASTIKAEAKRKAEALKK
jgi:hypothetical protein